MLKLICRLAEYHTIVGVLGSSREHLKKFLSLLQICVPLIRVGRAELG